MDNEDNDELFGQLEGIGDDVTEDIVRDNAKLTAVYYKELINQGLGPEIAAILTSEFIRR